MKIQNTTFPAWPGPSRPQISSPVSFFVFFFDPALMTLSHLQTRAAQLEPCSGELRLS